MTCLTKVFFFLPCISTLAVPQDTLPVRTEGLSIVVFGGNGFLGLEFVEKAASQATTNSLTVAVVHRGNDYWGSSQRLRSTGAYEIICDRAVLSNCSKPQDLHFDVVVDFSARNGIQIEQAANWAGAKVYMLISSEAVYSPRLAFAPTPIEEHVFVLPIAMGLIESCIANSDRYIANKIAQEVSLYNVGKQPDMCVVALRLPFVIGHRDLTYRLAALQLLLEAGEVALSGAGHIPISFIDAASVASAALHVILRAPHHRVCGEAFNVAQSPMSLKGLCEAVSNTTNVRASLIPVSLAESIYDAVPFSQLLPLTLSTRKLEALGWSPSVPLITAVTDAAAFNRESLLNATTFKVERAALERKMHRFSRRSAQLDSVLRRYGLRPPDLLEEMPAPRVPSLFLFLVLLFGTMLLWIRTTRIWAYQWAVRAALVALVGWWVGTAFTTGLVTHAIEMSLFLKANITDPLGRYHIWSTYCLFTMVGEFIFGCVSVYLFGREVCSARLEKPGMKVRAFSRGYAVRLLVGYVYFDIFYYFFVHKQAGRFQGDGLGILRPGYESTLPAILFSHEAYQSWNTALVVLVVYTVGSISVAKTVTTYALQINSGRAGVSMNFYLVCFAMLASAVALFETHHVHSEKLRKPAGWTGCLFAMMWFCGMLPLAGLALAEIKGVAYSKVMREAEPTDFPKDV